MWENISCVAFLYVGAAPGNVIYRDEAKEIKLEDRCNLRWKDKREVLP